MCFAPFSHFPQRGAALSDPVAVCNPSGPLFEAHSCSPPAADRCSSARSKARTSDRALSSVRASWGLGQQAEDHGWGGQLLYHVPELVTCMEETVFMYDVKDFSTLTKRLKILHLFSVSSLRTVFQTLWYGCCRVSAGWPTTASQRTL